jgi:hypothetical protein
MQNLINGQLRRERMYTSVELHSTDHTAYSMGVLNVGQYAIPVLAITDGGQRLVIYFEDTGQVDDLIENLVSFRDVTAVSKKS